MHHRNLSSGYIACDLEELSVIAGQDWWNGLVDWTTGLNEFSQKSTLQVSEYHEQQ